MKKSMLCIRGLCVRLERASVVRQIFEKKKKKFFWLDQVAFLGHVVPKGGIQVDPKKIEAVIERPRPTTVTKVRSFWV